MNNKQVEQLCALVGAPLSQQLHRLVTDSHRTTWCHVRKGQGFQRTVLTKAGKSS